MQQLNEFLNNTNDTLDVGFVYNQWGKIISHVFFSFFPKN